MAGKTVSFEYKDKKQLSDITVITRLADIFLLAVSRADDATFTAKKDQFTFHINHESFLRLAEQRVFPGPLVAAFEKADARLSVYDQSRTSFRARLWDSLRFSNQIQQGSPLAVSPHDVAGVDGLRVIVRRYGLAKNEAL